MREELIQKIEEAFADVPYPGDDNIWVHYEGEILVGHTDWRQVPVEIVFRHSSSLLDLTDAAYHFYLPTFMCAALRYPEESQGAGTTAYSLMPNPPTYTWKKTSLEAISLFSASQKAAIIQFLEILAELFPDYEYALLEESKANIQRAIQFWKES